MTGARLLPVGTVYDPFVNRGLDALLYACYMDARFLLVSTPSGITLSPEGGQHQSVNTPLIGIGQDRLASYEPAHIDELAILLRHALLNYDRNPQASLAHLKSRLNLQFNHQRETVGEIPNLPTQLDPKLVAGYVEKAKHICLILKLCSVCSTPPAPGRWTCSGNTQPKSTNSRIF